jgi:hypothetical protein
MHLVHVDHGGTAFLKLRPRFEMRPDQRVVRIDEAPVYDAPPTSSVAQDAARNHELEAAYRAQGVAYRSHGKTSRGLAPSCRIISPGHEPARAHASFANPARVVSTERGRIEPTPTRRGIIGTFHRASGVPCDIHWRAGSSRRVPLVVRRKTAACTRMDW